MNLQKRKRLNYQKSLKPLLENWISKQTEKQYIKINDLIEQLNSIPTITQEELIDYYDEYYLDSNISQRIIDFTFTEFNKSYFHTKKQAVTTALNRLVKDNKIELTNHTMLVIPIDEEHTTTRIATDEEEQAIADAQKQLLEQMQITPYQALSNRRYAYLLRQHFKEHFDFVNSYKVIGIKNISCSNLTTQEEQEYKQSLKNEFTKFATIQKDKFLLKKKEYYDEKKQNAKNRPLHSKEEQIALFNEHYTYYSDLWTCIESLMSA